MRPFNSFNPRSVSVSCVIFAITLCAVTASSAPHNIGAVAHIDAHFSLPKDSSWRWEHSGSKFLQLHFRNIHDKGLSQYEVVIRDYKFNTVARYDKATFSQKPEFWTGLILGDTVLIEVRGSAGGAITGLQFDISDIAYEQDGGKVLSVVGDNQIEQVYKYTQNKAIAANSRSVARLTFVKSDRIMSCSGFLVDNKHLMTNNHCISDATTCESGTIWFGFENVKKDIFNPDWEENKCSAVVRTSVGLDYSILLLAKDTSKWGHLKMTPLNMTGTEPTSLYIIQHPGGESKQISFLDCAVSTINAKGVATKDTDFGHTCDTMSGSSGAPVFDQAHRLIGLHHLGRCKSGRWKDQNRAVLGAWILNDLKSSATKVEEAVKECIELQ